MKSLEVKSEKFRSGVVKMWLYLPLLFTFHLSLFTSCIDEVEHEDTPQGNFEALWQIIDEHYCFFDYKQHEYGLDWQQVYNIYKVRANDMISEQQLFEVLTDMLSELRDGHVNLFTTFDYGRYWKWHENYPTNFSDTLQRRYLGTDYRIAGGMKYRILDDNIGYIYYGSFSSAEAMAAATLPMPRDWRHASATRRRSWATCSTRRVRATTTSRRWNLSISNPQAS